MSNKRKWRKLGQRLALEWRWHGFRPEEVMDWVNAGFAAHEAAHWHHFFHFPHPFDFKRFLSGDYSTWDEALTPRIHHFSAPTAARYRDQGLTPREALKIAPTVVTD